MTVSTTASREQYATDGTTTAFPIHFPFFDEGDVNAVYVAAGGTSQVLALAADFSVTGGGGAGGTLSTAGALAAGGTLTIFRSIPFTQEDNYVENDPLPAATLEGGFDRAAMRDQQLQDGLARAITLPVTIDPAVSAILPAPQPLLFLRWNSAGTALELAAVGAAGSLVSAGVSGVRAGTNATDYVTPSALASLWRKGADIASAATLAKPADAVLGGYHVITGTTQVQHMWAGGLAGESYWFECAAALPVKMGSDLVTRTGADMTFAPGDRFRLMYFGAGVWKMTQVEKADGSSAGMSFSFAANKNEANQTGIVTGTATKVTFTNEAFDVGSSYDAPNSKFVAPIAGKYLFTAALYYIGGVVDQAVYYLLFYKNGSEFLSPSTYASGTSVTVTATILLDLAPGDYVEVYAFGTGTGNKTVSGHAAYTFFQGARLA
jgi:hypothetical protein